MLNFYLRVRFVTLAVPDKLVCLGGWAGDELEPREPV
jgi:hypothetical protein